MKVHELLNELLGVKKFADMTDVEVIKYLKELGGTDVKVLGRGELGLAIQIGENVYKMWQVDSAYEAWVKYALKHQDNPFIPKFKGGIKMPAFFIRSKDAPDHVSYIQVERLTEIQRDVKWSNGDGRRISMEKFLQACSGEYDEDGDPELHAAREGEDPIDFALGIVGYTEDADPNFKLFVETMRAIFRLHPEFSRDLHVFNVMMRGRQLVIIDPLADMGDLQLNSYLYAFTKKLRSGEPVSKKPAAGSKHAAGKAPPEKAVTLGDIIFPSVLKNLRSSKSHLIIYSLEDAFKYLHKAMKKGLDLTPELEAEFKELYRDAKAADDGEAVERVKMLRDGDHVRGSPNADSKEAIRAVTKAIGLEL